MKEYNQLIRQKRIHMERVKIEIAGEKSII